MQNRSATTNLQFQFLCDRIIIEKRAVALFFNAALEKVVQTYGAHFFYRRAVVRPRTTHITRQVHRWMPFECHLRDDSIR